MSDEQFFPGCIFLTGIMTVLILIVAALLNIWWGWIVPDIFSGAVERGLVPATITMWQAIKVSFVFCMLALGITIVFKNS